MNGWGRTCRGAAVLLVAVGWVLGCGTVDFGEDLDPLGSKIIDCCLSNGTLSDYAKLIPHSVLRAI